MRVWVSAGGMERELEQLQEAPIPPIYSHLNSTFPAGCNFATFWKKALATTQCSASSLADCDSPQQKKAVEKGFQPDERPRMIPSGGTQQGRPMPIHEPDAANPLGGVRLSPKLKAGDLLGCVSTSELEMEMQIDQRKCAVRQRTCGFPPNSFLWTGAQLGT